MAAGESSQRSEQRTAQRFALNKPAKVQLPGREHRPLEALVTDISTTGAGLIVSEQVAPSSRISLALPVARTPPGWTPATVVRCEPTVGELFVLGVAFEQRLSRRVLRDLGLPAGLLFEDKWRVPLRLMVFATPALALLFACLWLMERTQRTSLLQPATSQAACMAEVDGPAGAPSSGSPASRPAGATQPTAPPAGAGDAAPEADKDRRIANLRRAVVQALARAQQTSRRLTDTRLELDRANRRCRELTDKLAAVRRVLEQKDKRIADLTRPRHLEWIRPNTSRALAGLDRLRLVADIADLRTPQAGPCPVRPEELTRRVQGMIASKADRSVLASAPFPADGPADALHVRLHLLRSKDVLAYNLAFYVRRACQLADGHAVVDADVWRFDYAGLIAAGEPLDLQPALQCLVDRFLRDYTSANPAPDTRTRGSATP